MLQSRMTNDKITTSTTIMLIDESAWTDMRQKSNIGMDSEIRELENRHEYLKIYFEIENISLYPNAILCTTMHNADNICNITQGYNARAYCP